MKKAIVFALLTALCLVRCSVQVIYKENNSIADAINGILEGYFEQRESKVDLIFYGVKGGSSEKIVEEILRSKTSAIPVKVMRVQPENNQTIQTNLSSIHIFDSQDIYNKTFRFINYTSNPTRRYEQIVHIPDLSSKEIRHHINQEESSVVNVNFLTFGTNSSNAVELVGMFRYTPPYECDSPQSIKINRFVGNPPRWENSTFFPKHFQNFNWCPLSLGKQLLSSEHKILKYIFATIMNHLNFQPYAVDENSNVYIDILLEYGDNSLHNFRYYSGSVAVEDDTAVFMIPPGEPYTQLEKMFLMFDHEVWIAIGGTFIITLTIIQVINCMSAKVRNFVYGRNIRSPTLNFVDIFLNGGQNQVPQRNFARFVLMLFVVWSLVIRTCYQSTLYALLQTDLRKPRCETIDELIENNFTLYYHPNNTEYLLSPEIMEKFKFKKVIGSKRKFWKDQSIKYAFVNTKNYLINARKQKELRGKEAPYYALAEEIRSLHMSVFLPKFSPLFERFNELIERLVTHGFIVHWNDNLHGKGRPIESEDPGPQVLSLRHIGIGFVIIVVLLALSILVFAIELVYHKFH